MIGSLISLYRTSYVNTLVYMLQGTEYRAKPYLAWYWRTRNFGSVMKRRKLDNTKAARLLKLALSVGILIQIITGIACLIAWQMDHLSYGLELGLLLIISYPLVWAHLVIIPLFLGRVFIIVPREFFSVIRARKIFSRFTGTKIAVAGSYGKTSMKEMLLTVLSEGKKTAATPANKNTPGSHAIFASRLKGDEEILIVEYGEGKPGDIKHFVNISSPNLGVITGVAPAHLDGYKTLDAAAKDIFYLAKYLSGKPVYVNRDIKITENYLSKNCIGYSNNGSEGWKVEDIKVEPNGLKFNLKKGDTNLKLHSGLVGKHQVGPLSAVVSIAHHLGLSEQEIIRGVAKTKPFEHRMQPRNLHGAWIIDDTYNGNIEGIRVGLEFLKAAPAKRKVYVTPGLVDQGRENKPVHNELGRLIRQANPDVVVLMTNSATPHILEGMDDFKGELILEHEPLKFYTNLDIFVAAGDVVLMQNDWTDNYA